MDLIQRAQLIDQMRSTILEGEKNITHIPRFLRQVINTEAWRDRQVANRRVQHPRFIDFINAPPPAGMGWSSRADKEAVARLLREDPDVLSDWRRLLTAPRGKPGHGSSKRTIKPERGNSLAYTLGRLHRERPDLYTRVIAKKLSAHAAAIAAGFRKQPSALDLLRKAWAKATKKERAVFLAERR